MINESHSLDKIDEYEKLLMKLTHFNESKNHGWFSSIMDVKGFLSSMNNELSHMK
jgi:hypothetical protein